MTDLTTLKALADADRALLFAAGDAYAHLLSRQSPTDPDISALTLANRQMLYSTLDSPPARTLIAREEKNG